MQTCHDENKTYSKQHVLKSTFLCKNVLHFEIVVFKDLILKRIIVVDIDNDNKIRI